MFSRKSILATGAGICQWKLDTASLESYSMFLFFLGRRQCPLYGGFRACPQSHGDPPFKSEAWFPVPLPQVSLDITLQTSRP